MATSPLAEPNIKNKLIAQLLQQGSDTSPISSHWQGLNRVAQSLLGGYGMREQETQAKDAPNIILQLLQAQQEQQGQAPSAPQQNPLGPITSGPRPPTAPPARVPGRENVGGMPIYSQGEVNPMDVAGAGHGNAIASIESGGRYNLQGPVTRTGDRAYGKFQVMGNNVPSFTREATGTAATPQQFLANPDLQENTFNSKFADYINRYGSPEAASRAWFAGEGGMNDPSRRDQLGTTVANYGQRFAQAAGVPQGGQAAMPQGGAPMAPPQGMPAAPQQMAQAPQQPAIPPYIAQMVNHPNPNVRAYGTQLLQKYTTPNELKSVVIGERGYVFDPRTGTYREGPDATKQTPEERNLAAENRSRAQRGERPLSITEFESARKSATTQGQAQGEAVASLESIKSKMPGLVSVVKQLDDLSNRATYTWSGQATDAVRRQLEMEPRPSAVARQKYISMVDNQILPLLRDTFGAQFTAREGDSLRSTLGNPDLHPREKQAVLRAFIEQKRRDVEDLARRTGNQTRAAAPSQNQNDPLGIR